MSGIFLHPALEAKQVEALIKMCDERQEALANWMESAALADDQRFGKESSPDAVKRMAAERSMVREIRRELQHELNKAAKGNRA